jgi:flagella basal body P-ring formation protein FlgA
MTKSIALKPIVALAATLAVLLLSPVTAHPASAPAAEEADSEPAREDAAESLVRQALEKKLAGARIEIIGQVRWSRGQAPERLDSVSLLSENSRGEAIFIAKGRTGDTLRSAEGAIGYAAWVPARVAKRRVLPHETLTDDAFARQELNIASGMGFEYRGVVLPAETEITRLEARQTIVEGQFLVSSAVQRVPDIRRGDAIRVQLISNGLTLSTLGTAEEPGYIDGQVRVMTTKTKRALAGKLRAGGVVEVNL